MFYQKIVLSQDRIRKEEMQHSPFLVEIMLLDHVGMLFFIYSYEISIVNIDHFIHFTLLSFVPYYTGEWKFNIWHVYSLYNTFDKS